MSLKILVEYYNDEEAKLFEKYPNYDSIKKKMNLGFELDEDEFLTYMVFVEQMDEEGFRTYEDLKNKLESRVVRYRDYLDLSDGTIKSKFSPEKLKDVGITEMVGISLGLNVVNQLHDLTEADWEITPNKYSKEGKKRKDFDYMLPLGATKNHYVQVENKGSVVSDNTKSGSRSTKYNHIKEKKKSLLEHEKEAGVKRHDNIYYGTIGVIDSENTAKVYLVDPPPFQRDWTPVKHKLITRLSFYHQLFILAGEKDSIIKALHNRILKLVDADDIFEYDKKPLEKIKPNLNKFVRNIKKPRVANINTNEASGTYYIINSGRSPQIYIIAVHNVIFKLIMIQDFNAILDYEYDNADMEEKVIVELTDSSIVDPNSRNFGSSNTYERDLLDLEFVFDSKKKKMVFQKSSKLRFTSAGRIFGVVS